jgi:hypothetical protein
MPSGLVEHHEQIVDPDPEWVAFIQSLMADHSARWTVMPEWPWVDVSTERPALTHGWKLQVSASVRDAREILGIVAPVLINRRMTFKFLASSAMVGGQNGPDAPRGNSGTFIEVYPATDDEAVRIAGELDRLTRSFAGPAILSGARLRPGSNVYYRYGGFASVTRWEPTGRRYLVITGPDGNAEADADAPSYRPPSWVTNPFAAAPDPEPPDPEPPGSGEDLVLRGRYQVHAAVAHANRGGTYLATDRETGRTVLVKEARPDVAVDEDGADARDHVRREAALLRRLAGTGRVAPVVDEFEEQRHVFVVTGRLAGERLERVVSGSLTGADGRPLRTDAACRLRAHLRAEVIALVESVHDAGLAVGTLHPGQLLVTADQRVMILDLEGARELASARTAPAAADDPVGRGFRSPERRVGRPASPVSDHYAVAAILAYLTDGQVPDHPIGPSWGGPKAADERTVLAARLRGLEDSGLLAAADAATALAHLGYGAGVRATCPAAAAAVPEPPVVIPPGEPRPWSGVDLHELIEDGCRFLLGDIRRRGNGTWVTTAATNVRFDPLNIQYGISGVGLALCWALGAVRDPQLCRGIEEGIGRIAAIVDAELGLEPEPGRNTGLYFGTAGAGLFLLEAAPILEDPNLAERARPLLCPAPGSVSNPDLTHGLAGLALGQLLAFDRTGDDRYLDQAGRTARELVGRGSGHGADGTVWLNRDLDENGPDSPTPSLYLGHAHGLAGIAHALLGAGAATGDERLLEAAASGLRVLVDQLRRDGAGTVSWANRIGDRSCPAYWCNGAGGIGALFTRASLVFDSQLYREIALDAAAAVCADGARLGPSQCHGLTGGIELLLDAERLLGVDRRRQRADLCELLWRYSCWHGDLQLIVDDSRFAVSAGFNVGVAGTVALLLRLCDERLDRHLSADGPIRDHAGRRCPGPEGRSAGEGAATPAAGGERR